MSKLYGFNRKVIIEIFNADEAEKVLKALRDGGIPIGLAFRYPMPLGIRLNRRRGVRNEIMFNYMNLEWYKQKKEFRSYRFVSALKFVASQKEVTNSGKE